MILHLTDRVAVAAQLAPADIATAAAAGFTTIVNNRPDDEVPGQPAGAAIAAAASAAGLHYVAIPVDHYGIDAAQIDATAAVLSAAAGPVLAYCRSGTRSATLWALAAATLGDDPDAIIAAAMRGGFALAAMRPTLARLNAARSRP